MILGAHHRLAALAGGRGAVVDLGADAGRADEGHRLDVGMLAQAVGDIRTAMDHVQHARRQAGFQRQLRQEQRRGRILLGRLEHEGVAAGHGDGEHEAGQHHREVERGDAGAHAQRLNQRVDVDAGGGVLGIFAQLQVGDRAGVLDHFQAAADFALGVGQGLAVLARDHLGQLGGVGAQQVLELQHDAHARALPGVAPGLERFLGIGHRQVQFLARGEGHLGDHFLRGRIDHVPPFSGLGLHELAADH